MLESAGSLRELRSRTARSSTNRGLLVLACLTAVLLNHSARLAGVNLSVADPFMVLLIATLALAGRLVLPLFVLQFFFTVVGVAAFTALVVTPVQFGVPAGSSVLAEIAKMSVSLLYLLCGIAIGRDGLHMNMLRWFSIGAAGVALLGLSMEVVNLPGLRGVMYYGDVRFRGFMADPNYWTVLASAAIAFLLSDRELRRVWRTFMIAALLVSVFMAGSKTGLITAAALFGVYAVSRAVDSRQRVGLTVVLASAAIGLVISWDLVVDNLLSVLQVYLEAFPQLARVVVLLEDPVGAISESGSQRSSTWESGLAMIDASPIFGVGAGSYLAVSGQLFGEAAVAHNTYIQLAAEWGLPLALLFFGWLVILISRATRNTAGLADGDAAFAVRNMVIAFLIGSLSLSLNNARMFWVFVGVLIWLVGSRARDGLAPQSVVRGV